MLGVETLLQTKGNPTGDQGDPSGPQVSVKEKQTH